MALVKSDVVPEVGEISIPSFEFSNLVRDYESERNELLAASILRYLNESLDVNVILKSDCIQQKLFISSISKILTLENGHSQLSWSALRALELICDATENANILSSLSKLTPLVSKILFSVVKADKKVRVLKVLQTLTFGIEIPRPDCFVAPLVTSLVTSSKGSNENFVVQLSLSVLANMLHKNKVVLYTLMQTVNLKEFMKDLLRVRSNVLCRMEVCKIMFLLEDLINEKPDETEVLNFIKVSFCTVIESGISGNRSQLLHIILFFEDMVNRKKVNVEILDNPWFCESVRKVIDLLDTERDKIYLDSAMLLFKFIRIFIEMRIPSFSTLEQVVMRLGLEWVSTYTKKSMEAILTIHSMLKSQLKCQSGIDETFGEQLKTVFLPLLKEIPSNNNDYAFLTALIDFLSETLELKPYSIVVKEHLEIEVVETHLKSFAYNSNIWSNFSATEPVVKMYIYLLHFISKCPDSSWLRFYTCICREQNVILALAAALMLGSSELKGRVLSLVCSVGFPSESIVLLARSMADCVYVKKPSPSERKETDLFLNTSPNSASIFIEGNKLIRNLQDLIKQNKSEDISTTQILRLYEYKEQVNSDYQRSLVASLTTSSGQISLLQDEVYLANQITSGLQQELYCLRPALEDMREKYDGALKIIEQNEEEMFNLKKRLNEELASCRKTIQTFSETLERQEKETLKSAEQMRAMKDQMVQDAVQISSLEQNVKDLQNECEALKAETEDINQRREKLCAENADLTKEMEHIYSELKSKGEQIIALQKEKILKDQEIEELSRIRDTVYQIAGGKKKF